VAGKKLKTLPFSHKLVLHQWLCLQFGYDPLAIPKANKGKAPQPLKPFATMLGDKPGGLDTDNLHRFYKHLDLERQTDSRISADDLRRYEVNIVGHTMAINDRRARPIEWKHYQWLSLLFAELYLDRYFTNRRALRRSLNEYVIRFNRFWTEAGYETAITPFSDEELNKVCLQNATGSGKTLLMHVNFLQFRDYAQSSDLRDELTRTILITPNENLSDQHQAELKISSIRADRLVTDSSDLFSAGANGFRQIDFTEVTKLGDDDGPNTIAVRNLGDSNLLLVDEAHRGMGSKEESGWFANRAKLVGKGFVFEYSATFKEAVSAAKDDEIEAAYAKSVLFDYSYRYFYEDGYGKDYRIFNLPKTYKTFDFAYLTAALLSFYQQLRLYEERGHEFAPFNIEKPLWVFVGARVTGGKTKVEKGAMSDVARIVSFLASFLSDNANSAKVVGELLAETAEQTGLLDDSGHDIFAGSFDYLKQVMKAQGLDSRKLLRDIHKRLFQSQTGGELQVARIKGDDNEIMLRAGGSETPFGLINVGDASGLCSHIESRNLPNVRVLDAEFASALFGQVTSSDSPVNILLGSKRFVEGWDCWRVSSLGLMHVGKSEGSQIIQLFGRGVRLKGYDWSLQRSNQVRPHDQPDHIQYVETLNVFGIEADFMEQFRSFLRKEGLPGNDSKEVYTIPMQVTYDFGQKLKVLRPRMKRADGREYDFKRDGPLPVLNGSDVPEKLKERLTVIDLYPRIQSVQSRDKVVSTEKHICRFDAAHLAFLDYDKLYFRLEKFTRERNWHNFTISPDGISQLLRDVTWYELQVPKSRMALKDISNIGIWQEMALELLQKYTERLYQYEHAAFLQPRLELREIEEGDENLPAMDDEYRLIVDASEDQLIRDIKDLKDKLAKTPKGEVGQRDLKGWFFRPHLYEPLLYLRPGSAIKVSPVALNQSEWGFVTALDKYLKSNQDQMDQDGREVYLLRNESRGRGMGFFEAGNFYPDFLLWQVKNGHQYLTFIEPHGLMNEGIDHPKINFHRTIKEIEGRLSDETVTLNSFILSPTRISKLNWGATLDHLNDKHVLFMQDQPETYISEIFKRIQL